ncbi:MAG: hypothetical protein JW966_05930 [Anaerolineae bacterium]|nr:hypothetical protein [Anaerolineae bacterium]
MSTIDDGMLYNQDIRRDTRPLNGAFKGRGHHYLSLLACPVDGTRLRVSGDTVTCAGDSEGGPAHDYRFEDGILRLVAPDRQAEIAALSEAHESACAAQGWTSPDEGAFKRLPQTGLPGYPDGYWAFVAHATALLWRFLEMVRQQSGGLPVGPVGEAVVIGAGNGWLAYALDVAGYTTIALDTAAGPRYGLGVYSIARYLRVQADPLRPPLARRACDVIVFQDGLVRSGRESDQRPALDHAVAALRPGGWLAVMHAPGTGEDAINAAEALVTGAGLLPAEAPRQTSWRARLNTLRERLIQRDTPPSPVLFAQKEPS